MIGALVSAGIGAATSLIGGISSARKARKAQQANNTLLNNYAKDREAWYQKNINQDYSQRSDVKAAWEKQREMLLNSNKQASATNIVAGGTPEAEAISKEQASESLANSASNIAAQGAVYKDNIEQQHLADQQNITQQRMAVNSNQAAQSAQAGSTAINVGGGILANALQSSSLLDFTKKKGGANATE